MSSAERGAAEGGRSGPGGSDPGRTGGTGRGETGRRETGPGRPSPVRGELVALLAVTLLAAALRFFRLGEWSFWLDEVLVLVHRIHQNWFLQLLVEPLRPAIAARPGDAEFLARLVPCLAGVATVPALHLAARGLLGRGTALLAALLLALSPWHLEWSQNARPFTLLLLFAVPALFAFHRLLVDGRARWAAVSVAFTFAALAAHYTAVLLLPVFAVHALALALVPGERPAGLTRRNLLLFAAPFLVASLPLLVHVRNFLAWYVEQRSFLDPLRGLDPLVHLDRDLGGLHVLVLALAAPAVAWRRRPRLAVFLATATLVPLASASLLSTFLPVFSQHVILSLAGLVASLAVLVTAVARPGEVAGEAADPLRPRLLAGALLLVVLVSFVRTDLLYHTVDHGRRRMWRQAVEWLEAERGPHDLVLAQSRFTARWYSALPDERIVALSEAAEREAEIAAAPATWALSTEYYLRLHHGLRGWVEEHCREVEDFHQSAARHRAAYYRERAQVVGVWRCEGGRPMPDHGAVRPGPS